VSESKASIGMPPKIGDYEAHQQKQMKDFIVKAIEPIVMELI
jgi:hypothetical protein